MEFKKILFFFMIISPILSKTFGSRKNLEDISPELEWLLDGEGAESNEGEGEKYTVCDTKQCKIIANDFKQAMNKSVDPCDDFHEYVCGNWKLQNPIPPYELEWGRLKKFQQIVFSRIKEILEVEPESTDILPVRQAKKWYRSCMDTDSLEKRGLKPLESILVQLGGWPMTMDHEEWNEDDYSWQSIEEHYFHITGSYIFYEVTLNRRTNGGIVLAETELPLYGELESKYRNYTGNDYDSYVKLIEEITKVFVDDHKANVPKKMIKDDARNLVEFEKKLYMIKRQFRNYGRTTIDDFVTTYNGNISEISTENDEIQKIDFRRLIRRVFDMVNYDIEDSERLWLDGDFEYWIELTKILHETSKRTIVNYIHWHFVSSMVGYTTENMRQLIWRYRRDDFGVTERKPRWLQCVGEVEMTAATAYVFTKKYFHNHTEMDVREMIDNIRDEMKSQIEKSNWLDEESKALALDKLKDMKVFLGFPDWYRNKTSVLNSYNGLTIGFNHFVNVLSYQKYKVKRALRKIFLDMSVDPTLVNAAYDPMENTIELPAADFQAPLFTAKLPRNINYGIAGVVIGHEIGHGFDDQGIRLGKDGNETEISKVVLDMYYQRAECFLDQYNKYVGVSDSDYDESTLNCGEGSFGRRTRGENIADTTGLQSVFEAYQKMIKKKPNGDYRLPGFEQYNDKQMFFISFAAMLCEDQTPKFAEKLISLDSHSPARLRVIGAISNTNDFARAFNCPKGSPMNPDNKCTIWKSLNKNNNVSIRTEPPLCYMR